MQTRELKDKSKLTRIELAVLIAAGIVTITIVSTCSPLFPFNPWDDTNCFFTLGRGIIHGVVPYRDLYEQKGPILYFLYALAALISEKSFIGAWVIECIAASFFSVFTWKTAKLFIEPSKIAVTTAPLLLGIIYTVGMFNFGGNAEELCLPLLTIILYFGFRSIVEGDGLPAKKEALIIGVLTGILFWIKFTFLGVTAGMCIYILILTIKRKNFKCLWSLVWRFLAGLIVVAIPVLIYFAANKALYSLWEAYFYNNIFLYHTGAPESSISVIPVIGSIYNSVLSLIIVSINFPLFAILLVITILSLIIIPKEYRKKTLLLFFLTFIPAVGFVYSREALVYYYGYNLACFFCFALIPISKGVIIVEKKLSKNSSPIIWLVTACIIILYAVTLLLGKNSYLMLKPRNTLAQFRMAETINETPNAKVLTYDVMDAGFFTAAGILPQNRFYCFLNIEKTYPAILEEQDRLIEEGYFDYIVTYYFCECDWDNYVLVEEEICPYVDYTGIETLEGYKLYKRI